MVRALSVMLVVLVISAVAVAQAAGQQPRHPIIDADSFNFITLEQEKPLLDGFSRDLQREPERKGYIFVYSGRVSCKGEAKQILDLIKSYLVGRHKVDAGRIVAWTAGIVRKRLIKCGGCCRGWRGLSLPPRLILAG